MTSLTGNEETCSITGTAANARFQNGFGRGWYGSDFDTVGMVDMVGDLNGPVCDEVIRQRVEAGTVVAYDNQMTGDVPPAEDIPEEAAARIFVRGAEKQVARLFSGDPIRAVPGRSIVFLDAEHLAPPAWMGPMEPFLEKRISLAHFERLGALFALCALANGQTPSHEIALVAGREAHRLALAVGTEENEEKRALKEAMASFLRVGDA